MSIIDMPDAIAVIGMSCRFPGAKNTYEFWENLKNGIESITDFSDDDLLKSGVSPSVFNKNDYVKRGFIIEDEDLFDASFFEYSPKEAEITDPQQRLFLETAWKALEEGGYSSGNYNGSIGVFAGSKISTYLINNFGKNSLFGDGLGFMRLIGNDKDYLATRASYKLNLEGPSISVQTACSTSLVSVHLACESLLNGECDMALAGGVSLIFPQKTGYLYQEGLMLSPDGRCRAFDSKAAGMAAGNGSGAVLLKRLEDAMGDNDNIHAVIRGAAVNNDGSNKVGYTTPSIQGQAKVIREALAVSEVEADSISYIETHGTGTELGDPVEINALKKVFDSEVDKKGYCAIGSVKTNIGHLDTAAGVAGLIKTILSLENKKIPPSLNFEKTNPKIDFEGSPFFVNTKLRNWEKNGYPRRAGVSSFGFGGTNAHVIVEEAPVIQRKENANERKAHLLTITAKTKKSLEGLVSRYRKFLEEEEINIGDFCFTAGVGRTDFQYRIGIAGTTRKDFISKLKLIEEGAQHPDIKSGYAEDISSSGIVFLFTGQGSQYSEMGKELYETCEYFKETMDECDGILFEHLDRSILSIIFDEKDSDLNETQYTQPALFVLEYAIAKLLISWGIKPDAVMGHSVGEYVAACISGALSLKDALRLISSRALLMQSVKGESAMYSLFCKEADALELIGDNLDKVSIAAVNGPENTVVSGEKDAVEEVIKKCGQADVSCRKLNVSHAFHSPMMSGMLPEFKTVLEKIEFLKPKIPVISNLTGDFIESFDEDYWCNHILEAVRFESGIQTLEKNEYKNFLEIGPSPVLMGMAKQCIKNDNINFIHTLKKNKKDWENLLCGIGEIYAQGINLDWEKYEEPYNRYRLSIPTYPFQRKRYWISENLNKGEETHKKFGVELDFNESVLGQVVETPFDEIIFEKKINYSNLLPSLRDHKIFNEVVYPAGALIELGLKGGEEIFESKDLSLKNLFIMEALNLKENESFTRLQTIFKKENENEGSFKIYSCKDSQSKGWKQLFAGDIIKKAVEDKPESLKEIKNRCSFGLPGEELYKELKVSGQLMGSPDLQCLDLLSFGRKEGLGKICFPDNLLEESSNYTLPPGFLDPCFHICLGIFLKDNNLEPISDIYLPVGMEKIKFYDEGEKELWAHVVLKDIDSNKTNFIIDINIYNTKEEIVCRISGLSMRIVSKDILFRNQMKDLSYSTSWKKFKIPQIDIAGKFKKGCWLIIGEKEEEISNGLISQIKGSGDEAVFISVGALDIEKEFKNIFINDLEQKILAKGLICKGIISLVGISDKYLEDISCEKLRKETRLNYVFAQELVRAVSARELNNIKICFLTKNSQSLDDSEAANGLSNSIFWGIRKTLAHEHPELKSLVVDIDSGDERTLSKISKLLHLENNEAEFALRNNKCFVNRLSPLILDIENKNLNIEKEGIYLITGGFGGMGLETAYWLSKKGAGEVVLIGRNEPSERAMVKISELKKTQTTISLKKVDICDSSKLEETLNEVRAKGAVKGIFHLAGVLEEGDLIGSKYFDIDNVMSPKVEGSWNLHELTINDPIDYFILFSSISSLWGGHGIGAYCCANGFLDILSNYRNSKGLPSLSLNWGAFSEVGMIGNDVQGNEIRKKIGITGFEPQEALSYMEIAMCVESPQICIAKINWDKFLGNLSEDNFYFNKIREDYRAKKSIKIHSYNKTSILNEILDGDNGKEVLENYLITKIAESLHIKKDEIQINSDLIQMGMDSLIFLDVSNTLTKELKVKIPPHKLFKNPTIEALKEIFYKEIFIENKREEVISEFPFLIDTEKRFEPFELTDIQQAYWVGRHGVMGMGETSCHTYYEIDVKSLEKQQYENAWKSLIEHHEMLRMIILSDGRQQILNHVPEFELAFFDYSSSDDRTKDEHLCLTRERMSHQVFDSSKWPLFEVNVTKLDQETSRLHISMDLLIADAHSIRLIFNQLSHLYKNPDYKLISPVISFRDYIINYEKFKESETYKKSRQYWLNRLESLPKAPDIPVLKRLEEVNKLHFTRRNTVINSIKWSKIKSEASKKGITPSGLLLSVYAKILSCWSKTNDFSINLTIFNRLPLHEQINEIIGDFTSVMFLEVHNNRGENFTDYSVKIQNQLWKDMEHSYFSGVSFLRELAQSRNDGGMDIMPVVFTSNIVSGVDENKAADDTMFGLEGDIVYGISQTPQVWMDLQVSENNGDLIIFFDAVEELFPQGMLDDMFFAYKNLLKLFAHDGNNWNRKIFDVIPSEKLEQKFKLNKMQEGVQGLTLYELFEDQVLKTPHNKAIITSDYSLTYEHLLKLANNLGKILHSKGVRPGDLIGVIMEKGWEQIVAVLGVLNIGAAYLPVDPELPKERMEVILSDGDVKKVLTQSWLADKFDLSEKIKILSLDIIEGAEENYTLPSNLQNPQNLAYVIYTSGSTGLPKGVMIDHRGAVNTILDINERFSVTEKDRIFGLSNLNFDLSVYDIFGSLTSGAAIVLPDNELRKDPEHWLELMSRENVSIWNSVPMLMQMLVEYLAGHSLKEPTSLRLSLLSGDWIPLNLPEKIKNLFKNIELISLGGATEASIWSILFPIEDIHPNWKSIPYGKPMKNQKVYVLDKNLNICPDWVTGDIYIGGAGLAKGYWKDKEKTENSFIKKEDSGESLYKTGDLGRYLPDGNIEFLGREDFQVKVNGYRIELGEIESKIREFKDVKEIVVKAENSSRGVVLVAYITKNVDSIFSDKELLLFLEDRLPLYMVPSEFIVLDSFFLTANGKIDRNSLSYEENFDREDNETELEEPKSEIQKILSEVWCSVLNIENVKINENFFKLKGDSLLAIKVVNLLKKKFKIDLPLRLLFENPTISKLSKSIENNSIKKINNKEVGII